LILYLRERIHWRAQPVVDRVADRFARVYCRAIKPLWKKVLHHG
jgi:hypothetical protein